MEYSGTTDAGTIFTDPHKKAPHPKVKGLIASMQS
jgi:hypothetical protein